VNYLKTTSSINCPLWILSLRLRLYWNLKTNHPTILHFEEECW